jgi:hypothetical protein
VGSPRLFHRAVVTMLLLLGAPGPLSAQQPWYVAYEDGKKAFDQGDYKAAEQKMLTAMQSSQAPRERGRRVLYYGQIRKDFFPEYYLSLIYLQQGRNADAQKYGATAETYLKNGDKEYGTLAAARSDAQKRLAANDPAAGASTGGGNARSGIPAPLAPPPPPPAVDARTAAANTAAAGAAAAQARLEEQRRADDQNRRARFETLAKQVQAEIGTRQFGAARSNATAARDLGVDGAKADELVKSVDVAESLQTAHDASSRKQWAEARRAAARVLELSPGNSEAKRLDDQAARSLASSQLERDALRAFYSGDYSASANLLERLVKDASDPARGYFYLACSNAAMGLLAGAAGEPQIARAQTQYARVRARQKDFDVDRRYISPRILQALDRPPAPRANR